MDSEPQLTGEPETMMRPVASRERVVALDVLRGFALFGILLVNIGIFAQPSAKMFMFDAIATAPLVDQIAHGFVRAGAEGKFITIFSTLFGIGFAIRIMRARERGVSPYRTYIPRMLVLAIFGILHAFVFWFGDILLLYAICGLTLPLFVKIPPVGRLILAITLILIGLLMQFVWLTLIATVDQFSAGFVQQTQVEIEAFTNGTWLEAMRYRSVTFATQFPFVLAIFGPYVIGVFVIGGLLWEVGFLTDDEKGSRAAKLRRAAMWVGGVAAAVSIGGVALSMTALRARLAADPESAAADAAGLREIVGEVFTGLAVWPLAMGFIAAVVTIVMKGWFRLLSAWLAGAGRMALTVYIAESAVATTIFSGWGLGYFGKASSSEQLLVAVGIFALLATLANIWLLAFRMGPLEWVWRRLTYRGPLPIRRGKEDPLGRRVARGTGP